MRDIEFVEEPYTKRWIRSILEEIGIPLVSYEVHGMSGRDVELFVPYEAADAIGLFFANPDYAGMTLEEYLRRMLSP